MAIRKVTAAMAAAWMLAGCGSGGGGSSGGGTTPPIVIPPPPPILNLLTVTPSATTIQIGEDAALAVSGHYSDGSIRTVSATWTILAGTSVSLSSTAGSAIVASGKDEGVTTVRASFDGKTATSFVTVEWTTPADPGNVYFSDYAGISKVMPGSTPPEFFASGGSEGLTINQAGTALYSHNGSTVYRHDLLTGATTTFASLPPVDPTVGGAWFGLDHDGLGRLYAQQALTGRLARITEATAVVEDLVGSGGSWDLAVTLDGTTLYDIDILGGGSFTSINIATGVGATAGYLPYEAAYYGFFIGSGIAVNRRGEVFTAGVSSNGAYKFVDLNGDGDMLDAGEFSIFGAMGDPNPDVMVFGLCVGRGRSVMVNVMPYNTTAGSGVFRLADLNMDGDADDVDETTQYSAASSGNGRDGGCIAAPR